MSAHRLLLDLVAGRMTVSIIPSISSMSKLLLLPRASLKSFSHIEGDIVSASEPGVSPYAFRRCPLTSKAEFPPTIYVGSPLISLPNTKCSCYFNKFFGENRHLKVYLISPGTSSFSVRHLGRLVVAG